MDGYQTAQIPNWLIILIPIVTTLLGIGAGWGVYRTTVYNKIKKNCEAINRMQEYVDRELSKLDNRVTEGERDHKQTAAVISDIRSGLEKLNEGMDWIKEELRARRDGKQ